MRASILGLVLCVGCAVQVDGIEGGESEGEGQPQLGVVESALVNSPIPETLHVEDMIADGVTEWTYTPHGLSFGANRRSRWADAVFENRSRARVKARVEVFGQCSNGTDAFSPAQVVELAAGASRTITATCPFGTTIRGAVASYFDIESSAADIGYSRTLFEPNANFVSIQDRFTDGVTKRLFGDWGAELAISQESRRAVLTFTNRGGLPLNVHFLAVVRCTNGTSGRLERNLVVNAGASGSFDALCPGSNTAVESWAASNGWWL